MRVDVPVAAGARAQPERPPLHAETDMYQVEDGVLPEDAADAARDSTLLKKLLVEVQTLRAEQLGPPLFKFMCLYLYELLSFVILRFLFVVILVWNCAGFFCF